MSDQMEALNNELVFQKQVNPKGTSTAALEYAIREIGRLRAAFRVNMLRLGHTDEDISRVLDAAPDVVALAVPE